VSNLLLITDVARLRKIFGRLTEDRNIRLRVVNNLEKGGEEIAIEKPDVVFVQTHLSGLSADILIMHLKKQLGRKRSRFVLLASPAQTSDAILKPYQGWLDTSVDDSQLLSRLQHLLAALLNKPKKIIEPEQAAPVAPITPTEPAPLQANAADSSAVRSISEETPTEVPPQPEEPERQLQVVTPATPELSLEEQGITYAPRQRLKVYSEFNSSFDSAVSSTPEPETLAQATPPLAHEWIAENIDSVEMKPVRSKRGTFLIWLAPVIIAVVAITFLQQNKSTPKGDAVTAKALPTAAVKPPVQIPPPAVTVVPAVPVVPAAPAAVPAKVPAAVPPVPPAAAKDLDHMSDKAVMTAIAENRGPKDAAPTAATGDRPTSLPDFIPRYGFDKKYSAANPGWERYKGQVTEFKLLREAKSIKAIQVIDRGGSGIPESFMKGVLHQVTKNPSFKTEASEKKEGYEIQRGKIAEHIKIVYYRDENGGRLRAFVLTWQ
jgi:hypothetical protein